MQRIISIDTSYTESNFYNRDCSLLLIVANKRFVCILNLKVKAIKPSPARENACIRSFA